MTLAQLAECARVAEQGNSQAAARAAIGACGDSDADLLGSIMRYAMLADEDVDDFMDRHDQCYQIKIPRYGSFWLAPLSAWSQLPSGAVVISPRGLKALAVAVVAEVEAHA